MWDYIVFPETPTSIPLMALINRGGELVITYLFHRVGYWSAEPLTIAGIKVGTMAVAYLNMSPLDTASNSSGKKANANGNSQRSYEVLSSPIPATRSRTRLSTGCFFPSLWLLVQEIHLDSSRSSSRKH